MSKQMTNELTFEQIDSWFRIGGPPTVQTTYVPRSSTKTNVNNDSLLGQGFGRGLTRPVYTPGQHSRPAGLSGRTDYAKQYREAFQKEQFAESDEEDDDDNQTVYSVKTSAHSLSDIESSSDLASLHIGPDGPTPPEIAVLAYQNYNFEHEYSQSLPITAHHDQVGLEKKTSPDTRLTYVTTGILLQKLINSRSMSEYTHIILDEVHERDQDTDFCMLVVRKLQRSNSRHVKVVLMSATFNTSQFGEYFGIPIQGRLQPPPVVNIDGRLFDVKEYYTDDLHELYETPFPKVDEPSIPLETYELAKRLILHFDDMERDEQGIIDGSLQRREVLYWFFCQTWVLPLHSTITNQEQGQVFRKAQETFRKIILATNIAESSITVPDIKYVIDFMLTKCMVRDLETNFQCLRLNWASKANAIQRRGRAGRVSNGRCYRLVRKYFYNTCIQEYGIPEMLRCPLEQLVLRVKILDLGEPKAILALALDPPDLEHIETTILLLKEVGALTTVTSEAMNPHDGELTFLGRILAALPVDVKIGKLIVMGYVFGCLKECLIIGIPPPPLRALSPDHNIHHWRVAKVPPCPEEFSSLSYGRHLEAYKARMRWANGSFGDPIAILNGYLQWEHSNQSGMFLRSRNSEKDWCRKNMIEMTTIREVAKLIGELSERLKNFNISLPRENPRNKTEADQMEDMMVLKMVLSGAMYPNYFSLVPSDEAEALRMLSGRDPCTTVMVKNVPNHGYLYRIPIASHFAKCGKGKKLYFEGNKCFVEFEKPHHSDPTSYGCPILPAVFNACKMRQLRMKLEIDEYQIDASQVQALEEAQENQRDWHQLKTNRIGVPLNQLGAPKQVSLPRADQTWTDLKVTEVADGNRFWANYADKEVQRDLLQLLKLINTGGPSALKNLEQRPNIGEYYLAPYIDVSGECYYRARIERVIDERPPLAEVFYLDYGNMAHVPVSRLKEMSPGHMELPFQGIECILAGIKPSPKLARSQWHPEARKWLTGAILEEEVLAKIYSVVSGVLHVELYQCMVDGQEMDPPLFINQLMVEKGFALSCEEPYISKISHIQREEDVSCPSLDPDWKDAPSLDGQNPLQDLKIKRQVKLQGPSSPYEINFSSMTRVGGLKSIRVEKESVNSVALSVEPQERYEKMMIAANIRINNQRNILLVRDSTIMPNIRGLPALCSMLFAPTIELRRDKKKTRLTGALCGLGWDHYTKQSVMPDHDIEVTFDSNITLQDIKEINGVRIGINLALASQDQVSSQYGGVRSIQKQARSKLLSLINKRREAVEPIECRRQYQWHLIPEEDLLDPMITTFAEHNFPPLYQYHKSVVLETPQGISGESADGQINLKLEHLEDLHNKANRSTIPFEKSVMCYLCECMFYAPRDLLYHLDTPRHRNEEEKLNFQ
ncbi:putative ATP-dependent RNA helicase TDRD9 isoform X2 [Apostichopus japonicus]|uniref:RNA helicase n=1 Tax=Stichopus japonicus TaxID=307972 RepID=A0A2G8KVV0_STIJA|nr:putative ATP-dependent RNA helicase TDRD9 isoform X2 [Apostichopus japonicus]